MTKEAYTVQDGDIGADYIFGPDDLEVMVPNGYRNAANRIVERLNLLHELVKRLYAHVTMDRGKMVADVKFPKVVELVMDLGKPTPFGEPKPETKVDNQGELFDGS